MWLRADLSMRPRLHFRLYRTSPTCLEHHVIGLDRFENALFGVHCHLAKRDGQWISLFLYLSHCEKATKTSSGLRGMHFFFFLILRPTLYYRLKKIIHLIEKRHNRAPIFEWVHAPMHAQLAGSMSTELELDSLVLHPRKRMTTQAWLEVFYFKWGAGQGIFVFVRVCWGPILIIKCKWR